MSTQNEAETDTLGQHEPNSATTTQCTSNQSPSPANQSTASHSLAAVTQRTSNQLPAAATQCTANHPHAAVVTRCPSDQSLKATPLSTVTLPQNTKKRKQSSMMKDKTKKKKVNPLSDENNTNQKKGSIT